MDKKTLHLLILEDNPDDVELIVKELEKEGFKIKWNRVETEQTFKKALTGKPDLILADYKLPSFTGMAALKIQQKLCPEIPLILVSSTIGEELAVECMKTGATDYVLKDRLSRLGPIVKRALKEAEERRERKKADEAQKKSEEQFRLIAENTSDNIGITTFNLKAKYIYVSPSVKSILGYDPEDLLGKSFFDFIHPDDKKVLFPLLKKYVNLKIKKLLSGKEIPISETIEFRFKNKTGNWRFMQSTVNIAGKQLLAVTRDITERKRTEKALQESEELFRAVFETAKDSIFIKDRLLRYIMVNPAMEELFEMRSEELFYKTDIDLFGEEAGIHVIEVDKKVIEGKIIEEFPTKPIGDVLHSFHTIKVPLKNSEGKIFGLCGIARDITARKQAEETKSVLYNIVNAVNTTKDINELFKSIQNYLGTIVDTTNFYVALYDKETDTISLPYQIDEKDKFTSFPAGKTLTAYVIRTGKSLLADEDVHKRLTQTREVETIGAPSKVWLGVPLKIGNEVIGVAVVQSYTDAFLYTKKDMEILEFVSGQIAIAIERKQAEEAIQKSEEKYRLLADNSIDTIWQTDLKLVFTYISPSIKNIMGYTVEEWVGTRLSQHATTKEFFKMARKALYAIKHYKELQHITFEAIMLKKDGTEIPVEITGKMLLNKKGLPIGLQGTTHDITERKKAEEQIKKDLKEKEVLLMEVHHRVKNNMQVVSSLLRLQSRYIENEEVLGLFKESQNRVRSMALIHQKVYQARDFTNIDFGEYVRSLSVSLIASFNVNPSKIKLNVDIKDISLNVNSAIPCGLIINELMSNSLKYTFPDNRKGEINVSITKKKDGKYILILKDNGVGLPENFVIENAKSLGLQLVTALTQQLHGTFEYSVDTGTTFKIEFEQIK